MTAVAFIWCAPPLLVLPLAASPPKRPCLLSRPLRHLGHLPISIISSRRQASKHPSIWTSAGNPAAHIVPISTSQHRSPTGCRDNDLSRIMLPGLGKCGTLCRPKLRHPFARRALLCCCAGCNKQKIRSTTPLLCTAVRSSRIFFLRPHPVQRCLSGPTSPVIGL